MEIFRDFPNINSGIFPEPACVITRKSLVCQYFLNLGGQAYYLLENYPILWPCLDYSRHLCPEKCDIFRLVPKIVNTRSEFEYTSSSHDIFIEKIPCAQLQERHLAFRVNALDHKAC